MKNKLLSQLYESCKKWKTLVLLGAMLLIGINTVWAETLHVRGYNNNWSDQDFNLMTGNSSPWTFTATWNGNYGFKIFTDNSSAGDKGWLGNGNNITIGADPVEINTGGDMHIGSIVTGSEYTITVTKDGSTYKIQVTSGSSTPSYPERCIAGNGWGGLASWNNGHEDGRMDNNGDGTYTWTSSSVTAGTDCRFVICKWGTWDAIRYSNKVSGTNCSTAPHGESGDNSNICFVPANTGPITVTYDSSTGNVTITCAAAASNYTVTYAVGTSYTSYGGLTAYDNTSSSAVGASPASVGNGHSVTFTASPNRYYEVAGFYSDASCTSSLQSGNSTTYTTTISSNKSVYVKFKLIDYTITYKDQRNVTYSGNNSASLIKTYNYGTGATLVNGAKTGYTFVGWYADSGCTGSKVTSISNTASGNKTFYAKWTEKMTTVTINVSPAGAGTLTVASSSFTPGNTTTAGVSTGRSVSASANSGYTFVGWKTEGNASGSSSTASITLKGNGSAGTGTLTAVFSKNVSSGWYLVGDLFTASDNWHNTNYPLNASYRGISNIAYRVVNFNSTNNKYFKLYHNSRQYGQNSGNDQAVVTGTQYAFMDKDGAEKAAFKTNGQGTVWCVADYGNNKFWVQNPKLYFPVTISNGSSGTNLVGTEGTIALTTNDLGNLATLYYEVGERINISVTAKSGYQVNTVTLGGNTVTMTGTTTKTGSATMPSSNATLVVTYKCLVKYSVGTIPGQSSAPTAVTTTGSVTVSNNSYVDCGTSVTFTAANEGTSYSWSGWRTEATSSTGSQLTSSKTYTTTISSPTTIYAVYTENKHTVAVGVSPTGSGTFTHGGSSYSSKDISGVGPYTASTAIVASPANKGWKFKDWNKTSNLSFASGSSSTTSVTIYAAADEQTLTAEFETRYGLLGSRKDMADSETQGMPGWNNASAADFEVASFTSDANMSLTCTRTLLPNRTYKFQVYDRVHTCRRGGNSDGTIEADQSWTLTGGGLVYLNTVGYGEYTFEITSMNNSEQPSIRVNRKASSQLNLACTYEDIDGTLHNGNTGGNVSAQTTEGGNHFTITNSQYVAADGSITFTANAETGYTFEGWYSDNTCETEYTAGDYVTIGENTLTLTHFTENVAIPVYAKFIETPTTVNFAFSSHGHVEIGGEPVNSTTVGITKTRTITAVPNDGYYFAGWEIPDGADFNVSDATGASDNGSKSTSLRGGGSGTEGTLAAKFVENEKIYFRNIFDDGNGTITHWDAVYVGFSDHWDNSTNCGGGPCGADTYNCATAEMQKIGSSDVYWAYVPHAFTVSGAHTVLFFDYGEMATWSHFDGHNASRRSDYNKALNMFIPHHSIHQTVNGTNYYSNGYWAYYGEPGSPAGYYIMRYNGSSYVDPANNGTNSNQFVVMDENTIEYSLYIDNTSSGHNNYRITSAYGTQYITAEGGEDGTDITTSNCEDNLILSEYNSGKPRFYITPTAEGIYRVRIDQSGDVMRIKVNYPVAVGDYRLKHTYNNGAGTTYSDIIKKGSSYPVTQSMYLNKAATHTMVLQRCESISDGKPSWSSGENNNLTSLVNGLSDNGVYQFGISINESTHQVSAAPSDIKLYTGNYYIKADSLPGNWTVYKSNIMSQNTISYDKSDSKTFDYYYCHWYGNRNGSFNTNVKCVIANDYNNMLSDTLKGDDVIGVGQTLPYPANVRFSYNSYTNEVKRTYLNGSTNYHDKFLYLEGTAKVDADGEGGSNPTANKMSDENNWTYMLDIKAQETARVRLTAKYGNNDGSGKVQDLIGSQTGDIGEGNTVEILGGNSESSDWHDLRIIYDYKTNFLLAAWLAKSDQTVSTDKAIHADVMILRENQGDAKQITINSGKSMSDVDTVYTAMNFTKSHLTGGGSEYAKKYYWVSFPYAVQISDVFGSMGEYAKDWVLREYDGKGRAANGFWQESASNWKFITDKSKILQPYQGYLLQLSLPKYALDAGKWVNNISKLTLYFPSKNKVGSIVRKNVDAQLGTGDPSDYVCSIDYSSTLGAQYNRTVRDSYWHCIGSPSFANETNTSFHTHDGEIDGGGTYITTNLPFLYEWNSSDNSLTPTSSIGDFKFKATKAYMVQCNTASISWTNVSTPSAIVARNRTTEDIHFAEFKLDIMRADESLDHTYVRLTDNEDASETFDFGQDLCKEFKPNANIYTIIEQLEAAGNSLPLNLNQTTIVPVGVRIAAEGEYTFAMPNGTNGIGVILVDKVLNTRTNLGLTDYTVSIGTGTINDRFVLEISPIVHTPTSIELLNGENGENGVRKVMIDGILYIVRDGEIFDARGARVK